MPTELRLIIHSFHTNGHGYLIYKDDKTGWCTNEDRDNGTSVSCLVEPLSSSVWKEIREEVYDTIYRKSTFQIMLNNAVEKAFERLATDARNHVLRLDICSFPTLDQFDCYEVPELLQCGSFSSILNRLKNIHLELYLGNGLFPIKKKRWIDNWLTPLFQLIDENAAEETEIELVCDSDDIRVRARECFTRVKYKEVETWRYNCISMCKSVTCKCLTFQALSGVSENILNAEGAEGAEEAEGANN